MNKSDLIEAVAEAADISKAAAGRAVDGMTDAIIAALKGGDTVSLIGFGTFAVKERAARTGRNPKTGATIEIGASRSPASEAKYDIGFNPFKTRLSNRRPKYHFCLRSRLRFCRLGIVRNHAKPIRE